MLVLTDYFWDQVALASAAHAVAGPVSGVLDLAKAALYKAGPAPIKTSVLNDYTVNAFTGYATKIIAWGAPWERPDKGIVLTGGVLQWQMTDLVAPETVQGWLLLDAPGTHLLGAEVFPAPIALATVLQAVVLNPQVVFGGADEGAAFVQGP